MKVLHVIDALGIGGGAEHSLVGMFPGLASRGVTSEVVVLRSTDGPLRERVDELGLPIDAVPPGRLPGRLRWLRRHAVASRADVVHSSLVVSCLYTRSALVGTPLPQLNSLVQTTYDRELQRYAGIAPWKLRTLREVDSLTARTQVDRFHALTAGVVAEAVEVLRIDPAKVSVVPRGRDLAKMRSSVRQDRAAVRASIGVDDHDAVLLNVARLDHQKAHVVLLEAFADVRRRHPRAVLVLAGREGNASDAIRAALDRWDLGGSVRILGNRTDVPDLLAASDMFVFPSISEGFGGAMVEAMAFGLPVVASDHPALVEVLGGGTAGVVVARGSASELAAGMLRLLDDPAEAQRLGAAGHDRFVREYELESVLDRMVELYRDVAGR